MNATCNDCIYDLIDPAYCGVDTEYAAKMLHGVPDTTVVKREDFLLRAAKGKIVLDIGCTGPLGEAMRKVANRHYGIDVLADVFPEDYFQVDLDRAQRLPELSDVELIIAGETIEHLSNAGHFLELLKQYDVPVIITTPNAYGAVGRMYMENGVENVNREHVCWYSWYTLKNLIERHGYSLTEWHWYNGKPRVAEGLIFCMEARDA